MNKDIKESTEEDLRSGSKLQRSKEEEEEGFLYFHHLESRDGPP